MATACISYLCSSFDLIDERVADSEKFLGVLRSYHGLHLYANEYWLQHLLAFRSVDELHVIRDSTLHASVARLVHRQTDLLQTTGRTTAPSHTNPNLEDEDPQLFVQNCLGFQEQLKTCKKRTGEGTHTECQAFR